MHLTEARAIITASPCTKLCILKHFMDIDYTYYFSMKFRPLGSSLASLCSQHPTPSPSRRLEGPSLLTSTSLAREHIFSLLSSEAFSYFWITDNWSVLFFIISCICIKYIWIIIITLLWELAQRRQTTFKPEEAFLFLSFNHLLKTGHIGWCNWFLGFLNSVLWFSWG